MCDMQKITEAAILNIFPTDHFAKLPSIFRELSIQDLNEARQLMSIVKTLVHDGRIKKEIREQKEWYQRIH